MANIIERNIFVLRDASCVAQPIEYVQGTNAVPILLHVRDFEIPTGSTARVYVEWPSTKGEYDESGVAIDGNDILIEPKDTLFSEAGKSNLQVCIVNGAKTLVTFSYPVMVKRNHVPGITTPAQNHSDFLDEYISNMQSATNSANEAAEDAMKSANEANEALEAFKGALEGTVINDETPSDETTYSSAKIEKFDIQSSSDTTLYNTAPGGYRLTELVGATEQKTLSGKNKLPCTKGRNTATSNGVTFTYVYDVNGLLQYVNANGTATDADAFTVYTSNFTLEAGNYILSGCPKNGSYSTYRMYINDETYTPVDLGNEIAFNVVEDAEFTNIVIVVGSGTTVSNLKFYPMIRKSDTDATYEPYCGGIPSPNTDYTQAIENTFDCVEMIQGNYKAQDGIYSASANYVCNKNPIPCKGGESYAIVVDGYVDNLLVMYYGEDGYIKYSHVTKNNITTTTPNEAKYFNFCINVVDGVTPETVGKISLTINGKCVGQIVTSDDNGNEKVATFLLNEPLRATDRVVKVDGVWYEEHKKASIDLGTFDWTYDSTYNRFSTSIPTKKQLYASRIELMLCEKYIAVTDGRLQMLKAVICIT